MLRMTGRLFVSCLLLSGSPLLAADPIEWKVLDRFRLFGAADEESRARVETLLDRLAAAGEGQASLLPQYAEMLATLSGEAAQSLRESNWSAANRTYSQSYLTPDRYRIEARLADPQTPGARCQWTVPGAGGHSIAPCAASVELTLAATPDRASEPDTRRDWGASADIVVTVEGTGKHYTTRAEINDVLVVAIGDSFISGEGNPDVPAAFPDLPPAPVFRLAQWPDKIHGLAASPVRHAVWWDEPCHRSLLSWPVLATLRAAAGDRHGAVTLVHLGCSGAEVRDGLIGPQISGLPGCPDEGDRRHCPVNVQRPSPWRGGKAPKFQETESQLAMLTKLLGTSQRRIDKLFLSIGGNDIGFVGVIKYLALPPNGYAGWGLIPRYAMGDQGIVCPLSDTDTSPAEVTVLRRFCRRGEKSAAQRLKELDAEYARLETQLVGLGIEGGQVYHTAYPNILEDAPEPNAGADDSHYCHHALTPAVIKKTSFREEQDRVAETNYYDAHPDRIYPAGFEAMQAVVPSYARWRTRWSFHFFHPAGKRCAWPDINGYSSEICKADWVWRELNRTLAFGPGDVSDHADAVNRFLRKPVPSFAGPRGWNVVVSHVAASRGHGWCRASADDPLRLPFSAWERNLVSWVWENGRQPNDFEPYRQDRERWFRTTNDSVLTQYGGPGRFFQGTIHPTFRSHIAVADAVIEAAFPSPAD